MITTLRADIYRLLHGTAFYITFIVLVVISVLTVCGTTSVTPPQSSGVDIIDFNLDPNAATPVPTNLQPIDGALALNELVSAMPVIVFLLLPLCIAIGMAMFSSRAVRNSLTSGMSRTTLYLSALTLSFGVCVLALVVYLVVGILAATIMCGWGDWGAPIVHTAWHGFAKQLLILLAYTSIGIFLSFSTRHTAIVTAIYIVFAAVPMFAMIANGFNHPALLQYLNYDLMYLLINIDPYQKTQFCFTSTTAATTCMSPLPVSSTIETLAVAAGYIIVTTLAGLAIFRKIEFK